MSRRAAASRRHSEDALDDGDAATKMPPPSEVHQSPASIPTTSSAPPLSPHATRVLLLGSGELGKEVAIELQRFGVEVIAADRYADAPGHAGRASLRTCWTCWTAAALRALIALERPHLVVPEIEAIHTQTLVELEAETGLQRIIPTARAARLTMDREGIRGSPPKPWACRLRPTVSSTRTPITAHAVAAIGLPCVVKPVMSSSGKGQSTLRTEPTSTRPGITRRPAAVPAPGRVIVEGFVDFDYEITLLTVRHAGGTSFCDADRALAEGWRLPRELAAAADVATGAAAFADDRAEPSPTISAAGVCSASSCS